MADQNDGEPVHNDVHSICTRGYKHRIGQLFRPEGAQRVDGAIRYVHSIMCNATMLVKYRLIKLSTSSLDHNDPPMIFNESQMWNAIRAVQHRYSNSIPQSDPISSDSSPDNLDAIPSKKKKGTEESSSTTPIVKKTRKKILKNKKGVRHRESLICE